MKSGIYQIKNTVGGKVYVGSSKDIELRWKQHRKSLNYGKHINDYLQHAWNKYGEKSFEFSVLEFCPEEELISREQHYIDLYDATKKGYNLKGAEPGNPFTDTIKRKISEANRKRKLSAVSKARISNSLKGKVIMSEENKQAILNSIVGKPLSEEHKRKISESTKGRKHSEEAKKKLSDAHKGKTLTAEHKKKIADSLKSRGRDALATNTKLNEEQVREIKVLLREGKLTQKKIGELYGVAQITISRIKTGRDWKHIQ